MLEQRFEYSYASAVHHLRHRLVAVPRAAHRGQVRESWSVEIVGSTARMVVVPDPFDNHVVEIRARVVESSIGFVVRSVVSWRDRSESESLPQAVLADRRLLTPTPLTGADVRLDVVARELRSASIDDVDFAERACAWSHDALRYRFGATGVATTASEALAGGVGVCQDYAHVMLALCRAAGVPARYVSGHLLGEGGSHAWVEVIVPDSRGAIAVAFDPTHDRRAAEGYLTVAIGREYTDVAPTSGSFRGTDTGLLTASKTLRVLDAALS